MTDKRFLHWPATWLAVLLLAFSSAGFGSGDHDDGHGNATGHGGDMMDEAGHGGEAHGHDGNGHSYAFGEPAPASQADRTVTIIARDAMTFSPSTLQVQSGETIRFAVKNVGQLQHSFTLAAPADQRRHEEEMEGMPMSRMASHMDDDPNGIVIEPGETGVLTWRFTNAGPIEFACHIPGHYPAGMKGRIRIR